VYEVPRLLVALISAVPWPDKIYAVGSLAYEVLKSRGLIVYQHRSERSPLAEIYALFIWVSEDALV